MSSLVDSNLPWSVDYVDLRTQFMSDEDLDALHQQHPSLPYSCLDGCPTCDGKGTYFWAGVDCVCDCEQQLELHKLYINSNIGELYQRLSWDDYRGDEGARQVSYKWLKRHRDMTHAGIGLVFCGAFGIGKSMMVSLVAKEAVKLGHSVFFCTFAEMIDRYTKGWGDIAMKAAFERKILDSEIFVLDDIGKEFRTKNNLAESTFDTVLRQRLMDMRPTFITTNMNLAELDVGYGAAIFSLIKERSISHSGIGDDFRPVANKRTLDEIMEFQRRPIF